MYFKPSYSLTLFVILLAIACQAQQRPTKRVKKFYFDGYIINNFNDTIFGRIKAQDEYLKSIRMIPDSLNRKITVKLDRIKAMQVNILNFEKVRVNGKDLFLERVAAGYYDLFAYRFLRDDISFNYYYLRLPDETISVLPENFQEIMEKYIYSNEFLRQKIESKTANYDQVIDIFRTFNRMKNTRE